jgi:uncharacterized phiE125 gp8 family phage protein
LNVVLFSAPALEPVTLAELKVHLRQDSETFAGNVGLNTCFAAGSHAIANNYTTHIGTGVEVLGKQAIVYLQPVNNGTSGTVDCKLQDSDDNTTWTDVTSGAFTQVTEANDTVVQEKAYTGGKRYVRTAAKVLVAACEFGTSVLVNSAPTAEDDLLTEFIVSARQDVEGGTRRAFITQTWDLFLDEWPEKNYIEIPFGNLQSVTSVKYTDCAGTETTLTEDTDYIVETNGDQHGRIVLPYQGSWPTAELYPSKPIAIRFICGYGATAASVPSVIRTGIKMICADLHEGRGDILTIRGTIFENKTVERLLGKYRLWGEF